MTHIGDMDRYLVLETLSSETGPAGSARESWGSPRNIWAQKIEGSRSDVDEDYEGQQKVSTGITYWVIHSTDVQPGSHRLIEGSEIYDVLGVQEEDQGPGHFSRGRFLRVKTEKKDND